MNKVGSYGGGVPESGIMSITGHSTGEMFDRYNTIDVDDVLNAADTFLAARSHSIS